MSTMDTSKSEQDWSPLPQHRNYDSMLTGDGGRLSKLSTASIHKTQMSDYRSGNAASIGREKSGSKGPKILQHGLLVGDDPKNKSEQNQKADCEQPYDLDEKNSMQASKELKELGNKARARLEEEKMKRPEVRLLGQGPAIDPEKKISRKSTTAFSTRVASRKAPSRKRKAESRIQMNLSKTARASQSNPVCAWTPDVSHIVSPEPKQRSATVKMHGLPTDCTLEHVKKFFTGLQPTRVSILLPNNTMIRQLDASNPPPRSSSGTEREEKNRPRILAHFRSSAAAVLASERSGETIRIKDSDIGKDQDYVVAVTVVSQELERALSFVSFPAIPRTSFADTLQNLIDKIHPMVSKVLWTTIKERMLQGSLSLDRDIRAAKLVLADEEKNSLLHSDPNSSLKSCSVHQRFAKHHNRLVDIQDMLLHQLPYPVVEVISDESSTTFATAHGDPAMFLTTLACRALMKELDSIQDLLYRARIAHNVCCIAQE